MMAGLLDGFEQAYPGLLGKLGQTWPAQMAQGIFGALTLPGDVYAGRTPVTDADGNTTQQVINRSADLAGMMTGGSYALAPVESNALGAGVRSLPSDNYLKPLSQYTDRLFRESSPEEALTVLPHSSSSAGYGVGGAPRQFYADTPELALGQGANKGVRIEYDADAFHGQINKKPGWEPLFQRGAAEYTAMPAPGANVRDAVRSVQVDTQALNSQPRHVQSRYRTLMDTLVGNGWRMEPGDGSLTLTRPTQ